jgi:hypothetical protein
MTFKQIVKDQDFQELGEVKSDSKRRVGLAKVKAPGDRYRVYANSLGQIILDPQVSIPASEAWIFKTPGVLESIKRGLKQSAQGKTRRMSSLAKHAHDKLD